jgi:uncharacterized membrane protein
VSESFARLMEPVSRGLEAFGVGVIVLSVAIATVKFLADLRRDHRKEAYDRYRANLGRGILLGLELLVGADIIATVTAPLTWQSVGLLGLIVFIRTFLSFSLETEIEGEWPWRRRRNARSDEGRR